MERRANSKRGEVRGWSPDERRSESPGPGTPLTDHWTKVLLKSPDPIPPKPRTAASDSGTDAAQTDSATDALTDVEKSLKGMSLETSQAILTYFSQESSQQTGRKMYERGGAPSQQGAIARLTRPLMKDLLPTEFSEVPSFVRLDVNYGPNKLFRNPRATPNVLSRMSSPLSQRASRAQSSAGSGYYRPRESGKMVYKGLARTGQGWENRMDGLRTDDLLHTTTAKLNSSADWTPKSEDPRSREPSFKKGNSESKLLDYETHSLKEMVDLSPYPNLQILLLSGNFLEEVPGLEACPLLWKLDASHNQITLLPSPRTFSLLTNLQVLLLHHNHIRSWKEVLNISEAKVLAYLTMYENPFCSKPQYRHFVVNVAQCLLALDLNVVTDEELVEKARFPKKFRGLGPRTRLPDFLFPEMPVLLPEVGHFDFVLRQLRYCRLLHKHCSPAARVQKHLRNFLGWKPAREALKRIQALARGFLLRNRMQRYLVLIISDKGQEDWLDKTYNPTEVYCQQLLARAYRRHRHRRRRKQACALIQNAWYRYHCKIQKFCKILASNEHLMITVPGPFKDILYEAVGKVLRYYNRRRVELPKEAEEHIALANLRTLALPTYTSGYGQDPNTDGLFVLKIDEEILKSRKEAACLKQEHEHGDSKLAIKGWYSAHQVQSFGSYYHRKLVQIPIKARGIGQYKAEAHQLAKRYPDSTFCSRPSSENDLTGTKGLLYEFHPPSVELTARCAIWMNVINKKRLLSNLPEVPYFFGKQALRLGAALLIQRVYRSYQSRVQFVEALVGTTLQQRAAVCLQRWWRYETGLKRRLQFVTTLSDYVNSINSRVVYMELDLVYFLNDQTTTIELLGQLSPHVSHLLQPWFTQDGLLQLVAPRPALKTASIVSRVGRASTAGNFTENASSRKAGDFGTPRLGTADRNLWEQGGWASEPSGKSLNIAPSPFPGTPPMPNDKESLKEEFQHQVSNQSLSSQETRGNSSLLSVVSTIQQWAHPSLSSWWPNFQADAQAYILQRPLPYWIEGRPPDIPEEGSIQTRAQGHMLTLGQLFCQDAQIVTPSWPIQPPFVLQEESNFLQTQSTSEVEVPSSSLSYDSRKVIPYRDRTLDWSLENRKQAKQRRDARGGMPGIPTIQLSQLKQKQAPSQGLGFHQFKIHLVEIEFSSIEEAKRRASVLACLTWDDRNRTFAPMMSYGTLLKIWREGEGLPTPWLLDFRKPTPDDLVQMDILAQQLAVRNFEVEGLTPEPPIVHRISGVESARGPSRPEDDYMASKPKRPKSASAGRRLVSPGVETNKIILRQTKKVSKSWGTTWGAFDEEGSLIEELSQEDPGKHHADPSWYPTTHYLRDLAKLETMVGESRIQRQAVLDLAEKREMVQRQKGAQENKPPWSPRQRLRPLQRAELETTLQESKDRKVHIRQTKQRAQMNRALIVSDELNRRDFVRDEMEVQFQRKLVQRKMDAISDKIEIELGLEEVEKAKQHVRHKAKVLAREGSRRRKRSEINRGFSMAFAQQTSAVMRQMKAHKLSQIKAQRKNYKVMNTANLRETNARHKMWVEEDKEEEFRQKYDSAQKQKAMLRQQAKARQKLDRLTVKARVQARKAPATAEFFLKSPWTPYSPQSSTSLMEMPNMSRAVIDELGDQRIQELLSTPMQTWTSNSRASPSPASSGAGNAASPPRLTPSASEQQSLAKEDGNKISQQHQVNSNQYRLSPEIVTTVSPPPRVTPDPMQRYVNRRGSELSGWNSLRSSREYTPPSSAGIMQSNLQGTSFSGSDRGGVVSMQGSVTSSKKNTLPNSSLQKAQKATIVEEQSEQAYLNEVRASRQVIIKTPDIKERSKSDSSNEQTESIIQLARRMAHSSTEDTQNLSSLETGNFKNVSKHSVSPGSKESSVVDFSRCVTPEASHWSHEKGKI